MSKEAITQKGVGVEYKKTVTAPDRRVKMGDAQSSMSGTQSAFSKATDSKKA